MPRPILVVDGRKAGGRRRQLVAAGCALSVVDGGRAARAAAACEATRTTETCDGEHQKELVRHSFNTIRFLRGNRTG